MGRGGAVGCVGRLAGDLGVGLAAGLAGAVAMTVSSTVEMKVRGRSSSSAPADAAGRVLGVRPTGERQQKRFATLVHYGYGTAWGGVRGLLAGAGLSPAAASAAHLALVWGAEQVLLPGLDVSPPATQWGAAEVAVDGLHHLVYAAATGAAYVVLDQSR